MAANSLTQDEIDKLLNNPFDNFQHAKEYNKETIKDISREDFVHIKIPVEQKKKVISRPVRKIKIGMKRSEYSGMCDRCNRVYKASILFGVNGTKRNVIHDPICGSTTFLD